MPSAISLEQRLDLLRFDTRKFVERCCLLMNPHPAPEAVDDAIYKIYRKMEKIVRRQYAKS